MNVTTLFHKHDHPECPTDERLYLLWDELDTHPEKRFFLNHCSVCDDCFRRWREISLLINLGSDFPVRSPDPTTRAAILEAAYRASREEPGRPHHVSTPSFRNLPGWRLAWAALFMIMSWGVYLQLEPRQVSNASLGQLETDILTLQQEIDLLQADLGLEFDQLLEETT